MIIDRLSIRVRITVGTLVLAAAFFGGAAILVHGQFESVLDRASAAVLLSDASPFQIALRDEPNDTLDRPGEDQLIAVIDPAGTVALSTLPAALSDHLSAIDVHDNEPQTVSIGQKSYLVLVRTQSTAAGTWIIIAAQSKATSALILTSLTTGLLWGLAALTITFGAASWLLTSAALRPIVRLRRSAESITKSGSVTLLPEGGARDEVRDLAITLNGLIKGLHASADREKQMVSDVSHELRTPLAALQGQLELIRSSDRSSLDDDLLAAERATTRMASLVTNLLDLSRLEGGSSGDSATVGDFQRELIDAIDRARYNARRSHVTIDFQVSANLPLDQLNAKLSAHDFGRIIDNLTANAMKALGNDGEITVGLAIDGHSVILNVDDNGPGIPDEFIPRATDRFSQLDDARAGGTGLGLSIVAAAVRHAGGELDLSNRLNRGLRVRVTLPVFNNMPPKS